MTGLSTVQTHSWGNCSLFASLRSSKVQCFDRSRRDAWVPVYLGPREPDMIIDKVADVETEFQAAGCFCLFEDRLLIIQRQRHKAFEYHWAIPTGKIEPGESARECIIRELYEELGLHAPSESLEELSNFIVEHEGICFEYAAFVLELDRLPAITMKQDEVRNYVWVPVNSIIKRRVVPYFYNTVQALLHRLNKTPRQLGLFPDGEAQSAKRRPA